MVYGKVLPEQNMTVKPTPLLFGVSVSSTIASGWFRGLAHMIHCSQIGTTLPLQLSRSGPAHECLQLPFTPILFHKLSATTPSVGTSANVYYQCAHDVRWTPVILRMVQGSCKGIIVNEQMFQGALVESCTRCMMMMMMRDDDLMMHDEHGMMQVMP